MIIVASLKELFIKKFQKFTKNWEIKFYHPNLPNRLIKYIEFQGTKAK
jgi:hypothetical protein